MLNIENFHNIKEQLESNYLFLDLEVDISGNIYCIALCHREIALDCFENNISDICDQLDTLKEENIHICGA